MSFPSGKGWYHGMEPRYLLMLIHYIYYCVVLLVSSARIKVPKDRGMTYSCSSYLVTEVTRPCVGRDLTVTLVSRDVPPEAIPCGSRKFLSLTICWKSIHPIRALYGFSCITCHSLMVVTTVWMVAIVGIVRNVYAG